MTQFKELSENPTWATDLGAVYPDNGFPLIVREECASIIEDTKWQLLPCLVSPTTSESVHLGYGILQELVEYCQNSRNFTLQREIAKLQNKYGNSPDEMVMELRKCLKREEQILLENSQQKVVHDMKNLPMEYVEEVPLQKELENLKDKIKIYKSQVEMLSGELQSSQQGSSGQPIQCTSAMWSTKDHQEVCAELTSGVFPSLQECLRKLHLKIDGWRHSMKFRILQVQPTLNSDLEQLVMLCNTANEALLDFWTATKKCHLSFHPSSSEQWSNLAQNTEDLLRKHMSRIFIVTEQFVTGGKQDTPEELVMNVSEDRSSQLSITARLLGSPSLGMYVSLPEEEVYKEVYTNENMSLDILNDSTSRIKQGSRRVYNESGGKKVDPKMDPNLVVKFEKITFPGIRRRGADGGRSHSRQADKRVTEEIYWVVLCVHLTVADIEMFVKTVCLPVTFITQVSQYWGGLGTLLWNAAFSSQDDVLGEETEVPWNVLSRIIKLYFTKFTLKTNKGQEEKLELTSDHLEAIKLILEKTTASNIITKENFLRDRMAQTKGLSFWKWLFACFCFIKDHREIWQKGLISGFLSKNKACSLLCGKDLGTFVVRFRETKIQECQKRYFWVHLCIFVVEKGPQSNKREVFPIRGYLGPDRIEKFGLMNILQAMESTDPETGRRKQLLRFVWPDVSMVYLKSCPPKPKSGDGDENYIGEAPEKFCVDLDENYAMDLNECANMSAAVGSPWSAPSSVEMSAQSPMSITGTASSASPAMLSMMPADVALPNNFLDINDLSQGVGQTESTLASLDLLGGEVDPGLNDHQLQQEFVKMLTQEELQNWQILQNASTALPDQISGGGNEHIPETVHDIQ